ncbi:MAG: Ig-like domain-containing protein [Thermoplasmata archaeon]|nr:MAG: Ig-like domain-containing protein [Thermoplasmata archaeon]
MPRCSRSESKCTNSVRTITRIWLGLIIILSALQVIPFNDSIVGDASALQLWTQSSRSDFGSGTMDFIEIEGEGTNALLKLETDEWFDRGPSTTPNPRLGHAMSTIDNTDKVIIFGGVAPTGMSGGQSAGPRSPSEVILDETWIYDQSENSWTQKTPSSHPQGRIGSAMVALDGTDKVLLFGGFNMTYYRDTWIYDLSSNTWTQKVPLTPPPARQDHGLAAIDGTDNVVMFGGNNGTAPTCDTWIYDYGLNTWTQKVQSPFPSPRKSHAMATIDQTDKALLYGGDDGSGNIYDETWVYDLSSDNWYNKSPPENPGPRSSHCMAELDDTDHVILFGGDLGNSNTQNESWEYDYSANKWEQLAPDYIPEGRVHFGMASIDNTDKILIFGGGAGGGPLMTMFGDTCVFDKVASPGTFISSPLDTGGQSTFSTISWTEYEPSNTDIEFQIRSAETKVKLLNKNFVGPAGSTSNFYVTHAGETLWSGHNGDIWIQYKLYLTSDTYISPEVYDITIEYNRWPDPPTLMMPQEGDCIDDNTPLLTWTFNDDEPTQQKAFQVQIDDDSTFAGVDYDSGEQVSSYFHWEFPDGTDYTIMNDGTWYWKVRTKDIDGDWGPYSNHRRLTIDTVPPNPFTPSLDEPGWTSNPTPTISFNTTDDTSGIDHFEMKIDTGAFKEATSPFTMPAQEDGIHNVTVRAYDKAGLYTDSIIAVKIDTVVPEGFTPSASPSGWTQNTQPEITFSTTDALSGIDHYELSVDAGTYSIVTSPYSLPPQTEGVHNVIVRAYDMADNYIEGNVDVKIDISSPSITHTSVTSGTKGYPITFTAVINDDHSGIDKVNLFFKKPADSTYTSSLMNTDGDTYTLELSSTAVTEDGIEYYIRASDSSSPNNVIYFGNEGESTMEPGPLTDIDITVTLNDITPPTITHVPITSLEVGTPITITATVTDDASGVDYVELYYRKKTDNLYTKVSMTPSASKYSGTIPGDAVTTAGIEYFIKAADKASPPNLAYFGAGGQVDEEPNGSSGSDGGIEIVIEEMDTTPPSVLTKTPEGSDVSVGTAITITFSEEMDRVSTLSGFSITPMITGSAHWESTVLTFTPDVALNYNTTYEVNLNTRSTDLAGNGLESDYSWSFTTTSTVDILYPTIIDKLPMGNDVPVDTMISVAFSEPMMKASVENAFSITPNVPGIFNWVGTTLMYTPLISLSYETQYQVLITADASDLVGNNLEGPYTWQFTTTAVFDKTPPTVIDRVPFGINVDVDTSISVAFSEQMLEDETKYAFMITPSITGVFDWLGTTLTFTPGTSLAYSTQYNVSITTNAKDLMGNNLEQNYTWSFITEPAPEGEDEEEVPPGEEKEDDEKSWDYWEPIITILTIVISLIIGLLGFIRIRKKQSKLRKYLDKIDSTYNDYKKNHQICEKELIELRESIKDEVKDGKIEEFHFLVLERKIDDYLQEMELSKKYSEDSSDNPSDIPSDSPYKDKIKADPRSDRPSTLRVKTKAPKNLKMQTTQPVEVKSVPPDKERKIYWDKD